MSKVFATPLASLMALVLLSGCSLAPTYQKPEADLPEVWVEAGADGQDGHSVASQLDWQGFVTDARLRQLIEQALVSNHDLRQTLLNVEAVRAQYRIQRADRLPGLGAQAAGTRQRVPGDLSGTGQSEVQSSYQVGLGITAFELDVFGRVRHLSQAAQQEYLATEEAARAVQISLVSEVIQLYLARDGAQRRYLLTEQALATREASLNLISQRRQSGLATELDLLEAQGLMQQARVDLERIDRERRQADNALALLVGADRLPELPQQPAGQLLLVQDLAAGTPSELLTNRPDIRAAEHRLRGSNASIGAARAAFFPSISLTGSFGTASAELSNLFDGGQRSWAFSPQINLPIFDGGRNRANLDLAKVRQEIAVVQYEQAIQTAFREVSDALVAADTLKREEIARLALVETSARTLRLSEARYRAGVDDHLRYLDAQRSDFSNQMALIENTTQRQIALAGLFRVLGGGWLETDAR